MQLTIPLKYTRYAGRTSKKPGLPLLAFLKAGRHSIHPENHALFGRGATVAAALADFDVHFNQLLEHPIEGDPASEFIRQRHI